MSRRGSREQEEQAGVAETGGTAYSRKRRSRRRRLLRVGVVAGLLVVLGSVYAALAPAEQTATASDNAVVNAGRALFIQGCAACHGLDGQGSDQGPSLIGVGGAAVDFQVGTGRMPLKIHGPEALRHQQQFTEKQIEAMAAYVATLGPGPAIPSNELISQYTSANTGVGGALFRTNCAQCHNFSGQGGALTYGKFAPSLSDATPKQIYEAMLTGPENMPVFGDQEITPPQKLAIINYIRTLKTEADPGGVNLGRIGPVSEGLVAWVVGIGVLVLSVIWIGSRA